MVEITLLALSLGFMVGFVMIVTRLGEIVKHLEYIGGELRFAREQRQGPSTSPTSKQPAQV
ncbi:MAG TPA: hypothetical protein VHB47_02980 [Thermoanaerobaculia bacterium]|jgi:hypothetical protein|nr:hypothetical protein [Thermoanaerobaculia bacterium]